MPKTKTLLISLAFLGLVGCATQRPQMPDDHYSGFAGRWVAVNYCAYKGWMDPSTAALGKTYVNYDVSTWTYDQSRLNTRVSFLQGEATKLSQGDCNRLAVAIQGRKQQVDRQNATTEIQHQTTQEILNTTRPTQTYCNRIGTQVLCNSF